MRAHFAIDVDQTVCGSNAHQIYAAFHNTDLHLDIDQPVLEGITSYREFLQLPQVIASRQIDERAWNASRHRAISTPKVLLAFSPIHGAAQGLLQRLTIIAFGTSTLPETTMCPLIALPSWDQLQSIMTSLAL